MRPDQRDDISHLIDGDPRNVALIAVVVLMFIAPTMLSTLPTRVGEMLIGLNVLVPAARAHLIIPGTGAGLDSTRLWVLGLSMFAAGAFTRARALRAERTNTGARA